MDRAKVELSPFSSRFYAATADEVWAPEGKVLGLRLEHGSG
jgi:hypothetical protein